MGGDSEGEEFVMNDTQVSDLSNWMADGAIHQERDSQKGKWYGEKAQMTLDLSACVTLKTFRLS